MKAIVVTQRLDRITSRNETRESLDIAVSSWLLSNGYTPIAISSALPSSGTAFAEYLSLLKPQGFLLSGGNDIGQYPKRDDLEYSLLNYAFDKELPVLGICRGMQIMACWAGATLKEIEGHVSTKHIVKPMANGPSRTVNSFHRLAIDSCPQEFTITSLSQDKAIESIRHSKLDWEGWMWHPERNERFDEIDNANLKNIFG